MNRIKSAVTALRQLHKVDPPQTIAADDIETARQLIAKAVGEEAATDYINRLKQEANNE